MKFGYIVTDGAEVSVTRISEEAGVRLYRVTASYPTEQIPEPFKVTFSIPDVDTYSVWSPNVRYDRYLGPNWRKRTTESRLASWMPLHALVSASGRSRMTLALSDAKTPTSIRSGVCEEDAHIQWEIKFFTVKVSALREYSAIIRIDTRDLPYEDAIRDAVAWWESDCG